ncbi:hypothetical protein NDU88_007355 [Pleurodeles waltl]|uniref:Uncharacterized protein n=1 Tax=Pleurodeles waltl TaxID=8319 RepID=A0AAV7UPC0_PLEWA|nr:hypothetical protein NDU88_007355 [Pleurodeles waltl]
MRNGGGDPTNKGKDRGLLRPARTVTRVGTFTVDSGVHADTPERLAVQSDRLIEAQLTWERGERQQR